MFKNNSTFMLCVLGSSANKIWELQAKFPENKDCMLSDHLSKFTGYLLTANHIGFLWHVQGWDPRILLIQRPSVNDAPLFCTLLVQHQTSVSLMKNCWVLPKSDQIYSINTPNFLLVKVASNAMLVEYSIKWTFKLLIKVAGDRPELPQGGQQKGRCWSPLSGDQW